MHLSKNNTEKLGKLVLDIDREKYDQAVARLGERLYAALTTGMDAEDQHHRGRRVSYMELLVFEGCRQLEDHADVRDATHEFARTVKELARHAWREQLDEEPDEDEESDAEDRPRASTAKSARIQLRQARR
jgi:hypothetical protein